MNDTISLPAASEPTAVIPPSATTAALSSAALVSDDTPAAGKRGRKSENALQRLERLQRAVADAKVAARTAERRKCAVVGEALLAEAETDAALRSRLLDILRRRVTSAQAKADIASLLL